MLEHVGGPNSPLGWPLLGRAGMAAGPASGPSQQQQVPLTLQVAPRSSRQQQQVRCSTAWVSAPVPSNLQRQQVGSPSVALFIHLVSREKKEITTSGHSVLQGGITLGHINHRDSELLKENKYFSEK